ncbi:MAG: hypothetical protein ACRC8A_16360 [Microcoleaceae cyanobacterium]
MKLYPLNILAQMVCVSCTLLSAMIPVIAQAEVFPHIILTQQWHKLLLSRDEPLTGGSEGGGQFWRRRFPTSEPPIGGSEGGGKGDGFCPVAPYQLSEVGRVWRDRLTLTWIGNLAKVEIREQGTGTVVWNQTISAEDQVDLKIQTEANNPLKIYQVKVETALKPGQTYGLHVSTNPPIAYRPIQFKVMTPEERNAVTQALQKLEQELAANNITGDAAKLRRADYFASQKLWLEFWQEVLSVEQPSAELKQVIQKTIEELCQ